MWDYYLSGRLVIGSGVAVARYFRARAMAGGIGGGVGRWAPTGR